MAAEVARGGKFAKPVTHHVLSDIDRHVAPAVMHGDRVTQHLREDGARAAPGAQHLLLTAGIHRFNFLQELKSYKRPFF